jgi:hypothetical protein
VTRKPGYGYHLEECPWPARIAERLRRVRTALIRFWFDERTRA